MYIFCWVMFLIVTTALGFWPRVIWSFSIASLTAIEGPWLGGEDATWACRNMH